MYKVFLYLICLCLLLVGCENQVKTELVVSSEESIIDEYENEESVASVQSSNETEETMDIQTDSEVEVSEEPETSFEDETENEYDVFEEYNLSQEQAEIYQSKGFVRYMSIDEYASLCDTTLSCSIELKEAINQNLFFAIRDLSTYNTIDKNMVLVNSSGEILREYENMEDYEEELLLFPEHYQIADFIFVSTKQNDNRDVFDLEGNYMGTFEVESGFESSAYSVGNGYYLFMVTHQGYYHIYILQPNGATYPLKFPGNKPAYGTSAYNMFANAVFHTSVNEGLFPVCYEYDEEIYAFYFDVMGERAIDLSENVSGFKVSELGDYVDGQAVIRFVGADGKSYVAAIDSFGSFIEEPTVE